MTRSGLLIALGITAVAGLLFGLVPELDILIARPFYQHVDGNNNFFAWRLNQPTMWAREVGLWVGVALIAPAIAALVVKLILPRRKLLISGRAIVFLTATLALAPGLMANAVFKDHWGRPRPIDIIQFGGDQHFVAWWDPRGDCPGNCSFVSGDVSGAFWTLAPAALAPPPWRALAYAGALALGAGMATLRMMAGGHFASDAIFAGVFTFLIIWFMYALIYRWPQTRLTDDQVERAFGGITRPGYDFVVSLLKRRRAKR